MNRFRLFCVTGLLACAGSATAADSIPTPSYLSFMDSCSTAAMQSGLKGPKLGMMGLMCHCAFKKVQAQPRLTQQDLLDASKVCEKELQVNPTGLVEKYGAEVERDLGPALK